MPLEYPEDGPFNGRIGRTDADSVAAYPAPLRPPPDAPNVVFVVLDDVGFAQLGCYGSDIATPNLDALAAGGVRYRNFHTTAMCSPARASLLTGCNHHTTGMGGIADQGTGYPGYHAQITKKTGFLSEILRDEGYATFALGKWHLAAARRPASGLLGDGGRSAAASNGSTASWVRRRTSTPPTSSTTTTSSNHPATSPRAITSPRTSPTGPSNGSTTPATPNRTGRSSCTTPRRDARAAPRRPGVDRAVPGPLRSRVGRLARRSTPVRSRWASSPRTRPSRPVHDGSSPGKGSTRTADALYARGMEVFAGFLTHTGAQIGRLVDHLRDIGELDHTIIVAISDNGASPEGGPHGSFNSNLYYNGEPETYEVSAPYLDAWGDPTTYPAHSFGWAHGEHPVPALEARDPRGWDRRPVDRPLPGGDRGPRRGASSLCPRDRRHADGARPARDRPPASIDGVPQVPMAGTSLRPTLDDGDAAEVRTRQYYELLGSRGIYDNGWKAVTWHPFIGQNPDTTADSLRGFDEDPWELYHVAEDFSESVDLAATEPERLAHLVELWWSEAGRYDVLPLHSMRAIVADRPRLSAVRDRHTYRPGGPVPAPWWSTYATGPTRSAPGSTSPMWAPRG
ncbi:MAG: sulfatase-like hydrolase/transferase [Acidimicrobiales bacterium]